MMTAPDFKQKQIVFVMLSRGEKLSFKNDNIVVRDANGKVRHHSTCYRLFALFLVGHVTITSGVLHRAQRFGFSVHLLSHNLKHIGAWQNSVEGNVVLRQRQYEYSDLSLAQHLVANKINQQIENLAKPRVHRARYQKAIAELQGYAARLPDGSLGLDQILGLEGIASRVYFSALFADDNWQGRKPRVKHDITNLLMDIGYTLLFNVIDDLLNLYGFDVYKGVYHQTFYQRKSLVCDLVEPFRTLIDYQIYRAWRLKQIRPHDFDLHKQQYRLSFENSEKYVALFLRLLMSHKVHLFEYVQQYYRAFMRGAKAENFPTFSAKLN